MKIVLKILAGIVLLIVVLVIYVLIAGDKEFEAPYPDIQASTDSTIIVRGKYLALGPAHCAHCHVPMDKILEVENGLEIPLIGGWELDIPPGTFRAPNLTPDKETGIGSMTDGEIARALRYSLGSDGRLLIPVMPFQELSDEDLTAIISYLRSQEPVKNEIEPSEMKFLGKALVAFGAFTPTGPRNVPPKSVARDTTAVYGKYLASSVANCYGCHTDRDIKSGEFIGEAYAGGFLFDPEPFSEGFAFVSPNITPDPETGIMTDWDEELFLDRFHSGRIYKGTPMPWGALGRMEDSDLKAIYRYLQSVEPVENELEKYVYAPGEELPARN
jgi:mono/diheme cytochrome c family protein